MESSLPDVLPQDYQSEILTHAGEVYDASEIDKTTEALTLAIAEKGYAFARVRPRPIPDAAAHTIGITYIVDEGPRIYIERINVIGNDRTKDYVIRREFRLAEGDAFNGMLVDRAKKRLQGLGIFKNVEVKRRPGSAPDRVVLDVESTEQSTGELSFGAGYSTSEGVIGDVSITERNLFGNGQYLRLGSRPARSSGCRLTCRSPNRASSIAILLLDSTFTTNNSTFSKRPVSIRIRLAARFVWRSRSPKTCGCRRTTRFRAMISSTLRTMLQRRSSRPAARVERA